MQIDWFTVIAEIINFLILLLLLKHFLYDRIIGMADAREAKVTARLKEAKQKTEEAQHQAEAYRLERQAIQDKREELIAQARAEAEAQRKEWLRQARCEIEETKAEWSQTIRQEQDAFMKALRQRLIQQTSALARRALADLADTDLEQHMIDVFVKRIKNLADDERKVIAASIQDSGRDLVVTSAFELPPEKRQKLLDAMRAQFGHHLEGQFTISSDLICGIEVKADSHKVTWSLEHYLTTLEENLASTLIESLNQESRPKDVEADE